MKKFTNRDISWLAFNLRVLEEATDNRVPLYERIKFISIFSSNLDEFSRVRYPYITTFAKLNQQFRKKSDQESGEEVMNCVQKEINRQLDLFGHTLKEVLIPELKENRIVFYYDTAIRPEHLPQIKELFLSKILSFIQPLYLDSGLNRKFVPENSKLYLFITLNGKEPGTLLHAIVNIPSDKLTRFYVLDKLDDYQYIIFLDDIIRLNLPMLFPGFTIQGVYSIKFNRNAALDLTEELSSNLLEKIEKKLKKRDFGMPSRFLYEKGMPSNLQFLLSSLFDLNYEEMFEGGKYHQLSDLAHLPQLDKALKYPERKPLLLPELKDTADIFRVLDQKDLLLHLPYQSYNPVLSFFNQAAVDSQVTDIYITLYRVAAESHIVNALVSAARNGKKVTACIELKARFDEGNNIKWSREMKKAGVNIIYGIPNTKVHSKIAVIIKKNGQGTRSYALLSTGNFNEVTSQFYTDHVLMTSHKAIIDELLQLFRILQNPELSVQKSKRAFSTLLVSRYNMMERFTELIEKEMKKAKEGMPSLIRIKLNNLEEQELIGHLYKASEAGVEIRMIVRSICCLVPGEPGMSSRITVKRLIDRYLEHSRLFLFGVGEDAEIILGSADWMNRNLHHRIEVCTPVISPEYRKELSDYFDMQWNDTCKTSLVGPASIPKKMDNRITPGAINAQLAIHQYLTEK